MRVRANDHVGTHLIACIFDAALRDFFGLAERSAHANDCGLMFFGPRPPSGYPLFLLRESLRFWQGIPCCHSRVRLAPEKHREKCAVSVHEISFPLRFAGSNKSSMYRCRTLPRFDRAAEGSRAIKPAGSERLLWLLHAQDDQNLGPIRRLWHPKCPLFGRYSMGLRKDGGRVRL
jgi:hypothetical protein